MADQIVGRLVYEVTQVGLAQLKRELEDLAAKPFKITPEISPEGRRGVSELDSQIQRLRNRVTGLRNEFTASGGDIGRYTANLKAVQREALELAKGLDRDSRAFVHLTGTAASAQRGIVSALRAQAMAVTPLQEQIARLQNQVHGLRNQYIAVGGPSDQFAVRMRQVRDEALRAAQGLSVTSKEFRQLQTVAAQAERAAVQALGGVSRLGLASQVRAGMDGFFGPGGVGHVAASAIGIVPGRVGQTAYFASLFARDIGRMNLATGAATAGTLALAGAMSLGTTHAARLQQQQRLLEAITLQNVGSYRELTRGILDLSTKIPVTTTALFDASEEAAKLGVDGSQNILAFTRAIQGLAFVTRGDVGSLAAEVAKFMNELGIGPSSPNYLSELDGVANALAAVHTWSAATADETITLSRYFAAIAAQVGLTAPQIIALSGSLAALGGQAQSSGTNLAKFFLDMARAADQNNRQLAGMARVSGMTTREFRELVRSDIVEAFLRVARGLNQAHGSAEDFASAMDDIGATNMRLIRVLGQASVGQETFLEILEKVNEAQRERSYLDNVLATATKNLNDETRLLFNTLSAIFAIMGEPVVEQLTNRVSSLNQNVGELYERFKSLSDEQVRAIALAGELTLGFVGIVLAAAALNSILGVVMGGFKTLFAVGAIAFSPMVLWIAGVTAALVVLRRGWDENWFGMRDASLNALGSILTKWEAVKAAIWGREFVLPPIGPGAEGGTVRVGGLRGMSLPDFAIPDWGAAIDAARIKAEESWEQVEAFFDLGSLPSISLPEIETPAWDETIDAALESAKAKWAEFEEWIDGLEVPSWPEIEPLQIPPIDISLFDQSWTEFVETVKNLEAPPIPPEVENWAERVAEAFSRTPAGQISLDVGRLSQEVLSGKKPVHEAIQEAITSNISIPFTAALWTLIPVGRVWKLTLTGIALALNFLPDADLSASGITETLNNTIEAVTRFIRGERPKIDLGPIIEMEESLGGLDPARLRELYPPQPVFDMAQFSEDLGRILGHAIAEAILLALGLVAGGLGIAGQIANPAFELGKAIGEEMVGPFTRGLMQGLFGAIQKAAIDAMFPKEEAEEWKAQLDQMYADFTQAAEESGTLAAMWQMHLEGLQKAWDLLMSSPARNPETPWYQQDFWTLMRSFFGFLGGFHDGGILPGTSGPDKYLAMVAPGEAIVPSKEVRGGWPAVLRWFREQGVPGFQTGKAPVFGANLQGALDYANTVVIQAQEQNIGQEIRAAFVESARFLLTILEQGGKTVFGEEFYESGKQFISDLVSGLSILRHGAPPTASLSVPGEGDDPTAPPDPVKTWWQELWEEIAKQVDATRLATAALGSFAQSVQSSESVLVRTFGKMASNLRFDSSGGLDLKASITGLLADAISFIATEIGNLLSISAESLKAQSMAYQNIGPGQDLLGIRQTFDNMRRADENRERLDRKYEELANQHRTISEKTVGGAVGGGIAGAVLGFLIAGPIGALIGGGAGATAGGYAANQAAKDALAEQMNLTQQQIDELQRSLDGYVQKLREALGLTANDFASAVQRAFSAVTFEDFEDSMGRTVAGFKTQLADAVNDIIRGALVQRFIAEVVATPISNLADMVFEQIASGAEPDMDAVQKAIEGIQDKAEPFYEMLDRLGLAGNNAAQALNRTTEALRNVPSSFRVALARFESTVGIPSLGTGGRVSPVPGGQIVRLAERGEAEWVFPESRLAAVGSGGGAGNVVVNIQYMNVRDGRDFGRKFKEELDWHGIVRTGNRMGGRGRR